MVEAAEEALELRLRGAGILGLRVGAHRRLRWRLPEGGESKEPPGVGSSPAPKIEKEQFARVVASGGGEGAVLWRWPHVSRKKKREGEIGPGPPHRIVLEGVCGLASISTRVEDRRTPPKSPHHIARV
jgi:hypothetical protein